MHHTTKFANEMEHMGSTASCSHHGARDDLLAGHKTNHALLDTACQGVDSAITTDLIQSRSEEPVATIAILWNRQLLEASDKVNPLDDYLPNNPPKFWYRYHHKFPRAR